MYNYLQWSLSLIVHVYYQTTAELADLRKSLKLANNQIEETRRKYLQSQEEQKKMKAILAKEIGDGTLINACVCFLFANPCSILLTTNLPVGVSMDHAMNGDGWRGRSQQIVMLKSKVKRLENALHETQNRY